MGGAVEGTGAKLGALAAGAALIAGAAIVGLGIKAVSMAGAWQSSMTALVTGAGESQNAIAMVSQGMLNMAVATGTSTQQLASGMFMIESAGYHGAAGLQVLQVAAEGAKVGNADLGTTADALTTIMKDYGLKANQAGTAMNFLTGIVQNGKTHLQDLAASMSSVLPMAGALHIHLLDVGGAMATMTGEGVPAANAATYLRQMLQALSAPAAAGQKALEAIGLTTGQVSADMKKSLPDTLKLIMDHLAETYKVGSPQYVEALKNISGGSKTMQGMLDLTGTHLKDFQQNVKNVAGVVNQGKGSVVGWSLVQQDFNFKLAQAKEAAETMGIKIGTVLLPILGNLMSALAPVITGFGNFVLAGGHIGDFLASTNPGLLVLKGVLIAIAGAAIAMLIAAIPPLVIAFGAWAVAAGAAAIATLAATWPILAIGAVVALVVAGIILAVQHWGQIVGWLQGVWSGFSSWFMGLWNTISSFVGGVFSAIGTTFHNFWSGLVSLAKAALALLVSTVTAPFNAIGALFTWLYNHNTYIKNLCDLIVNFFKAAVALIQSIWTTVTTWITGKWNALKALAGSIFSAMGSAIHGALLSVASFIYSIWNTITSWINGKLTDLKNLFGNAFSQIGTTVHQKITDMWNGLVSFASGWPAQALQWGVNLIQGLINGITNMIGGVINAVKNVAGAIGNFLGFHSPAKEGPGHDADTWMPNLVNMMVSGLASGQGKMKAALNNLMMPLTTTVQAQMKISTSGGSALSSPTLSGAIARTSIAGGGGAAPVININVNPELNMDGVKVSRTLLPHIYRAIQYNS